MTAYGTPNIRRTALDVISRAPQGARFTRLDFYNAMKVEGFSDRLEVGRLFSRLINQSRVVKAGECGLAFEYKVPTNERSER